jgi:hypothetical protein
VPLYGTSSVEQALGDVPVMASLDTQPADLPECHVLQVMYESRTADVLRLLPPALHPTIPPIISVLAYHCDSSEFGPFTLAQLRVHGRAGARGRGLLTSSVTDSAGAAEVLRARWGYNCSVGSVEYRSYQDRIELLVADGAKSFSAALEAPEPIAPGEVQYTVNVHVADTPVGRRLVQVDPEFAMHRADRGRPRLDGFSPGEWNMPGLAVSIPVSASRTVADVVLPKLRYLMVPGLPAVQGTEVIAELPALTKEETS